MFTESECNQFIALVSLSLSLFPFCYPLFRCFGETLSTLQFAKRAKLIKNKASTEWPNSMLLIYIIISLSSRLLLMKTQLEMFHNFN